MDEAYIYKEST